LASGSFPVWDLRKAGLTPAELKTYKREAQKAAEQVEQPKAAPEKTENPTELKPPVKPKVEDFSLGRSNERSSAFCCPFMMKREYMSSPNILSSTVCKDR